MEKISAVFDKNGLGDARSKADKQLKTSIIEKIFGTTSITEIEKMQYTELNFRRQELEELFEMLKESDNPMEEINSYKLTCQQGDIKEAV